MLNGDVLEFVVQLRSVQHLFPSSTRSLAVPLEHLTSTATARSQARPAFKFTSLHNGDVKHDGDVTSLMSHQ
jgi:hypothetical protein